MTEPSEPLLQSRSGGVLTLTLNRPQLKNAVDTRLWDELGAALHAVARGNDVRAVIVTGAAGNFCSGADLSDAAGAEGFSDPSRMIRGINDVIQQLHDLPVPTIAKVRGVAAGAGWNIALGCDLVVAAPGARFCQIFTRRALSPDCGGSWLLPKLVGLQQAKRLTLLADTIGAEEAYSLGLVTWVQPEESIDTFTEGIADRLAAGPPLALAQTKALVNNSADRTLRDALTDELRAQTINLSGADVIEAFAAFAEKRDPVFTGAWGTGGLT
ncbi:enoyl-CoA hydratase/isomerase family protein [Nocardia nova SH22a]|uniref:Enoyl-CoA hydratase/isomerase family protein n=1 Tax=Nocardia nova SH22a TaxID=1415166 RepID=W5TFU6_9NOCA|nr:enoyl-CoA hydratase-related protein [Nocardia nova]AHH18087.1 enoyl-CoA hydratase/isomerase family protein [Nocardia nova SH22a]